MNQIGSTRSNQVKQMIDKLTCTSDSAVTLKDLRDIYFALGLSEQDYIMEGKIQRTIGKVINYIKINRELNTKINEVDKIIGLLVKNSKIALSNEALHRIKHDCLKSKKRQKSIESNFNQLSKDIENKLESYEHLFYTLQTQPKFLPKLLFAVPIFRVSSFFKNCIFSLFCCETSEREVHLLSRLLKEALYQEVENKITDPNELIDGDSTIISIALDCHRAHRQTLFDFLKPVVLDILGQKELNLCLDPVTLYKNKRLSSNTDLTTEEQNEDNTVHQAINDSEVINRLNQNIPFTLHYSQKLLQIIISDDFIDSIPFGIKYICKYLVHFLQMKFNDVSKDLKTKVIMNVIFYRFIRPCILFPEAYLNFQDGYKPPSLKARINLGSVCKLLKASASGEKSLDFLGPFLDQIEHISALNEFIDNAWQAFEKIIDSVLTVKESVDYFNINEFEDELNPPEITITIQEVIEAHALLLKYKDEIASDANDPLDQEFHQLLDDCGPLPEDANHIIGSDTSTLDSLRQDEIMTMEITLRLKKKTISDITMTPEMTIKVKQALLELIKNRPTCKDLNQVLFRKAEENENNYFLKYKNQVKWHLSDDLKQYSVIFSEIGTSLFTLLDFTIAHMRHTEARNFDEILIMMKNDILNRLQYRQERGLEMKQLESNLAFLIAKRDCVQEILEYYQKYLDMCRESYHLNCNIDKMTQGNSQKPYFKCSAAKLKEKGILVSLGGVKPSQFKKVYFEMSPSSESILQIDLKMFQGGSEAEKVKLDLQSLLKHQYDGVKVINLLDKANLNIDLLLCLINQKFYLKKTC